MFQPLLLVILESIQYVAYHGKAILRGMATEQFAYTPERVGQVLGRPEEYALRHRWSRYAWLDDRSIHQPLAGTRNHPISGLSIEDRQAGIPLQERTNEVDDQRSRDSGSGCLQQPGEAGILTAPPATEDTVDEHAYTRCHEVVRGRDGRLCPPLGGPLVLSLGQPVTQRRHRRTLRGYTMPSTLDSVSDLEPDVVFGGHGR